MNNLYKYIASILLLMLSNFCWSASCTSNNPIDSVFNVKDATHYGAVGDGVTDDTTAIQCAIDDAIANQGGRVYLPIGVYAHTGLTIAGSSVHLEGAAESGLRTLGTRLLYTGTGGSQLYIGGAYSYQNHIKNLTFITKNNQTSGVFIHAEGNTGAFVSKLFISNVDIHAAAPVGPDPYGSGFNGILIDSVNTATLENMRITGLTGDYAIKIAGNNTQTDIIRLEKVLYNSFIEGGSTTTDGLVIEDNVYTVNTFGVDMLRAKRGFVIGSNDPQKLGPAYLFLTDITSELANKQGVLINNHDHYLEIQNCYVHISAIHGINISSEAGPTHISGCTIQRNGYLGTYGMGILAAGEKGGSIVGNFIADNHTDGIYLSPGTDGFSITSNNVLNTTATTNQERGIVANNGTKNNVIANNVVKCNTTNNVAVGAVTNSIINNNVVVPASSPDC